MVDEDSFKDAEDAALEMCSAEEAGNFVECVIGCERGDKSFGN